MTEEPDEPPSGGEPNGEARMSRQFELSRLPGSFGLAEGLGCLNRRTLFGTRKGRLCGLDGPFVRGRLGGAQTCHRVIV